MNSYRVLKPFKNVDGAFLRVNDTVSCEPKRASVLKKNGMIGGIVETAVVNYPIHKPEYLEKAIDQKPKQIRRKRKST